MTVHLDLTPLEKCNQSLRSAVQIVQNKEWLEAQTSELQQLILSGVVKNFEFVYEISVKMIKRYIDLSSLDSTAMDQMDFREILRMALEKGIINHIEAWFDFRKLRNLTAHTYHFEKALLVTTQCALLLTSVDYLLEELKKRNGPQP